MEIKCMKNGYRMQDAFERLYKRSKHFTIEKMDLLFYPYLLMDFEVRYKGKLERLSEHVLVMCDMWRGQYSMARTSGEFVMTEVEDSTVIPVKMDKMQVIKDAPRTVYGEIQKAKRVLNTPDIEYESDELVYKPFFIVECLNDDKEVFHILFDAVTGDFSLLNA
ncbi:MAG: hypothetical protein ACSW8G_03905 [Bacillota bacterium]